MTLPNSAGHFAVHRLIKPCSLRRFSTQQVIFKLLLRDVCCYFWGRQVVKYLFLFSSVLSLEAAVAVLSTFGPDISYMHKCTIRQIWLSVLKGKYFQPDLQRTSQFGNFLRKCRGLCFYTWLLHSFNSTLHISHWILGGLLFAIRPEPYFLWRTRSDLELFWHIPINNVTLRHNFEITVMRAFFCTCVLFCSTASRLSWQKTVPPGNRLYLTSITFLRQRASHDFTEVRTCLICKPNCAVQEV